MIKGTNVKITRTVFWLSLRSLFGINGLPGKKKEHALARIPTTQTVNMNASWIKVKLILRIISTHTYNTQTTSLYFDIFISGSYTAH